MTVGPEQQSNYSFVQEYLLPHATDYMEAEVWQILFDQFAADAKAAGAHVSGSNPDIIGVRSDQPRGNLIFVTLAG